MSINAMKQALEALEDWKTYMHGHWDVIDEQAVTALRQSIAEAEKQDEGCQHCGGKGCVACDVREQEPVAWMWRCKPYCDWPNWTVSIKRPADSGRDGNKRTEGYEDFPLYTLSPKREWVGLTDEEIDQGLLRSDYALQTAHAWRAGVVFAMTKLKQKNGYAVEKNT